MKEYFKKREYLFLYLSKFFYAFADAFVAIFGTTMLYKNGMPITMILLLYGLRFGIMGIASPLFLKISHKFGVANCALLANLLRVVATTMILYGEYHNLVLFLIVMSIPGALANPIEDDISNQYVETSHRGRYNSARMVARILGQFLASVVVAWGVITQNNLVLILVVSIFFLLDYLCTALIDYKPEVDSKQVWKKTIYKLRTIKNPVKGIYALRTAHIIERQFVPLYLFLALQDFKAFSMVMSVSLLLQMITVILTGKWTDKDIDKTNTVVSAIKIVITAMFLGIRNKYFISINKAVNDNFEKVYETAIQTSIQNKIKKADKEDAIILSTIGQMSLCYTEVIVFSILAFISLFVKEKIFYAIFILSIVSTILINKKCQTEPEGAVLFGTKRRKK